MGAAAVPILVATTVASTFIGIDAANQEARNARNQASREADALERQRKEDARLANQQISDIKREQDLADEQAGKDLINIGKFSSQEIGSIKAQQGASGVSGFTADLVVAKAEQNRDLDIAALQHAEEIDRLARQESIKRTKEANKFIQRESLLTQRDTIAAGRERANAARLRGISTAISGASRLASIKFPTVKESGRPLNPSSTRRRR